jgi:hypothetical protein
VHDVPDTAEGARAASHNARRIGAYFSLDYTAARSMPCDATSGQAKLLNLKRTPLGSGLENGYIWSAHVDGHAHRTPDYVFEGIWDAHTVVLWRTGDGGRHWSSYSLGAP